MENKEKTFSELITKNQRIIHKVCRIYTDDQEAHNDLFQEIVLQLWRSFDSFKGDSKFSTWMYRVGLNTAITYIRKKNKSAITLSLEEHHYQHLSNDYDEDRQEKLDLLYSSLKFLNDVERALVLLYLEDMNYKEISETLGITEGNARVKMNRVKNKLKEIMANLSN